VALTGSPNFSGAFVYAGDGYIDAPNNTFSGAATGKRYDSQLNGVIYTRGASTSYFPGSVAGTTATGAQYG
jgi:hypothetical protein